MKLHKTSMGLALGILWGAAVFLATGWAAWRGGGDHLILLNQFYLGYDLSYTGSLIGLVYGFVHGFVGGWVLAWLYNALSATKAT
jgi:hypothetical protein